LVFLEDVGHERLILGLINRVARDENVAIAVEIRNSSGGKGRAKTELKRLLRDIRKGNAYVEDMLVVALDSDTLTWHQQDSEIRSITNDLYSDARVICAAPDPHIEKWYLLDQAALRRVVGAPPGMTQVPRKTNKETYKALVRTIFREGGHGGILLGTYGESYATEMDLEVARKADDSFNHFVRNTLQVLRDVARADAPEV
jgi:hypothetical protein